MYNPLDVSKDIYDNAIINGLKYNIRNSTMQKMRIQEYIKNYITIEPNDRPLQVLNYVMKTLNIDDSELCIEDEHELLDWIYRLIN